MSSLKIQVRMVFIALSLIILSACGGGGGGSDAALEDTTNTNPSTNSGSVGLLITDGPADDFQAINLTVTKAELLSDDGSVTLFSGIKKFDLLTLENVTELFAVGNAPVGAYNKIRLTLEEIELIHDDGSVTFPNLPGNGKLDLNPQGTFFVDLGEMLLVQLDFDAHKSIHVVETGNGVRYNFRPVVFVKIIRDSLDTKLIRLTGTVNNLQVIPNDDWDLCDIRVQQLIVNEDESEQSYCVKVDTNSTTSFFDENGDPSDFSDLENGKQATVMGRFLIAGDEDGATSQDDQSSQDDDSSSRDDSSSTDDDSSNDNGDDGRQLVLIAEVVMEDGLITTIKGLTRSDVSTDPDESSFDFEPDQATIPEQSAIVNVLLQAGTRIYSREGEELTSEDIQANLLAQIDGASAAGEVDIKAAVIMLTLEDAAIQVTGTINDVSSDFTAIEIITDPAAETRCVNVENANVFLTELNDEDTIVLTEMDAEDLSLGQLADAFGDEDVNGCLNAHTVIYQDSGAVIQPI